QMAHPSLPLPLEGIPFDSAEMGKHYSRFCLPGEHTSTEIFSIGKSLDPGDLCLPDPDEDWFAYESAFYKQAASCEPVADQFASIAKTARSIRSRGFSLSKFSIKS
ncbi:MAG: hypothetical protein ACRC2V_03545, partial [Xenococcaceae cyanobacterium]